MLRNTPAAAATAPIRPIEAGQFRPILAIANAWLERRRSRRALAQLDERLLRDIGLSSSEAFAESAMPFWKPFTWLQTK